MARDTSIKSVLVIGSGPIVIGQACEFDYSGTQACRVLRAEGIRVILVNSNPATIMTDPEFADATYIEPITPEFIEQIIIKEKPDAVLATLGGQTALNAAIGLYELGTLAKYGVKLIGADVDAIKRGENRELFRAIVEKIGGESARSIICHTMEESLGAAKKLNYPVVVRPSFTMGGLGSGIAFSEDELKQIAGALARRICNYAAVGTKFDQTAEYGFIKFGSRVDLLLPLDAKINCKIGDVVKGGITVLANW